MRSTHRRHLVVLFWVMMAGTPGAMQASGAEFDPPVWVVSPQDFQYSMIIIGELEFDGQASSDSRDRVAAFVGDELRGVAVPNAGSTTGAFTLLALANTGGETLTFKAYDAASDQVVDLPGSVTFDINGIEGGSGVPVAWTATREIPAVPFLVSPPDGSIGRNLDLSLIWDHAIAANSYDLQLSTTNDFSTFVASETGLTLNGLQVGPLMPLQTYYWRVRGVGTGGESGWSSVFMFETKAGTVTPDAPEAQAPEDGAVDEPIPVTLGWNSAVGASSYDLHVSTFSDYHELAIAESGLTFDSATDAGSLLTYAAGTPSNPGGQATLAQGTTYYWRVRANNAVGAGAWSPSRQFTTYTVTPQEVTPDPPVLVSPENDSTQPTATTLSWNGGSGFLNRYEFELSETSDFSTIVWTASELTAASQEVTGLQVGLRYYWRVRTSDPSGTSDWSDTWQFSVASFLPGAASPLAPSDAAVDQPSRLWLSWQSAADATTHDLQVSTVVDFSSLVVDATSLPTPVYELTGLAAGTEYIWRVRGVNAQGVGSWSAPFRFTTEAGVPVAPTLLAPVDGSSDQPARLWFTWMSVPDAASYRIQISRDAAFSSVEVDSGVEGTTVYEAAGLTLGSGYYWRVRAENTKGPGEWSPVFSFSTTLSAPAAPMPQLPVDGAVDQPVAMTLSWSELGVGVLYDLQVSTAMDLSTFLVNETGLSSPSYTAQTLPFGAVVFWRVRATNAGGASAWSRTFRFSTIAAVAASPTLLAPANGSTDQPSDVWLIWQSIGGAESYQVQIATDIGFTALFTDETGILETQWQAQDLSGDTMYYWRVRGLAGPDRGPWSDPRSFATAQVTHTTVEDNEQPLEMALLGSYPNPFNPTTSIRYSIPRATHVRLEVFTLESRLIATLVDRVQQPGVHTMRFDADALPSGVYLYRLWAGGRAEAGRMILLR